MALTANFFADLIVQVPMHLYFPFTPDLRSRPGRARSMRLSLSECSRTAGPVTGAERNGDRDPTGAARRPEQKLVSPHTTRRATAHAPQLIQPRAPTPNTRMHTPRWIAIHLEAGEG